MTSPRLAPAWWVIRAGNTTRRRPDDPRVWSVFAAIGDAHVTKAEAQQAAQHWGAHGAPVEVVRAVYVHIAGQSSGWLLEAM